MAMTALSCTGLPIPSSMASSRFESASSVSIRATVEPCVGYRFRVCSTFCSPDSWTPLGLDLSDLNRRRLRRGRKEEKSSRRLDVVQEGVLRSLERNPKSWANTFGVRSLFAVVQAALMPGELEGENRLTSIKDYNSALLRCVRDGRMRDAMIVFKRFQGAGLRPDVVSYTTLIQGFGKLKSYKKVTDVFTQMQRSRCQADLKLCTVLINTFGNGGTACFG